MSSWGFNSWAAISCWCLLCCNLLDPRYNGEALCSAEVQAAVAYIQENNEEAGVELTKYLANHPPCLESAFRNVSRFVVEHRNSTRLRLSTVWHSWELGFGITKQCVARPPLLDNGNDIRNAAITTWSGQGTKTVIIISSIEKTIDGFVRKTTNVIVGEKRVFFQGNKWELFNSRKNILCTTLVLRGNEHKWKRFFQTSAFSLSGTQYCLEILSNFVKSALFSNLPFLFSEALLSSNTTLASTLHKTWFYRWESTFCVIAESTAWRVSEFKSTFVLSSFLDPWTINSTFIFHLIQIGKPHLVSLTFG